MARVKKGVNAHKRHKKVLKQAKGFYGQRRESTEDCGLPESTQQQELTVSTTVTL